LSHRSTLSVARSLAGNLAPVGLAGAVLLGALAGCWAGWNLTFAVLLTLALLLNINVRLFVLATAVAAATAWSASPLTHDLGQWLLDEHRLSRLVDTCGRGPIGALLAWDVYTLVGATPIGLGLGLSGAVGAIWLARRDACNRRLLSSLGDDTDRDGVVARAGILRPYGLLMALAVLPGWVAITAAVVPGLVREAALADLTRENHAEVSVGHWEYRLWSGELRCDDIRFADSARPDFDRLRIDRVTAQLDAADVLRGILHVRQLRLAGLATHRRRLEPAANLAFAPTTSQQTLAKPAESRCELSVDDKTYHDTLAIDVAVAYAGWDELNAHVRRYRTLCDVLARCAARGASSGGASSAAGTTRNVSSEYVALGRVDGQPLRCELDHRVTHTAADRIEIIGLPASWQLGGDAVVTVDRRESVYIGDKHDGDELVFRLRLTAPECASLELATDLNLSDPAAPQPLRLSMHGVSAQHVAAWNVAGVRLTASQGAVDVVGQGWIQGDGLDLSLDIAGEELVMSAATPPAVSRPKGAATINFDVLTTAVAKTRRLAVDARLNGSWQRPRMVVTPSRLLADLDYELLRTAREQQLAQQDSATRQEPGDVGFRAPQPPAQPPIAGSARPGAPRVARVATARSARTQSSEGMRVEVAQQLGVSIARPSRIYIEQPRPTTIKMPTGTASPAGPTIPNEASESITSQATLSAQQVSRRELLPPSWLTTGYDLGAQSTSTGRRWAAQQAEDRERADKVFSDRPTLGTGR
jgi:uncharacterized protein (TIGR03546 family)